MRRLSLLLAAIAMISGPAVHPVAAADQASIQRMVGRAAAYLQTEIGNMSPGQRSLAALALLKADVPASHPAIQRAIGDVRKQCDPVKGFQPDNDHIYSAAVGAVLLADADPDGGRACLEAIATYITAHQMSNGGWDYPPPHARAGSNGDTSATHYALLGLWACARAGVKIEPQVWEKSIKWHLFAQSQDGGYAYCPKGPIGDPNSTLNMTINAVGSMAIAWMQLSDSPPSLDGGDPKPKQVAAAPAVPRLNSVLEAVPLMPVEQGASRSDPARVPDGTLAAMKTAFRWIAVRFRSENSTSQQDTYYYYSLERMTGLINVTMIGEHDWYAECSDLLATKQKPDGSFGPFQLPSGAGTSASFIILSLVKSTAKLLKRNPQVAKFGDGLLQGGRGLPDNLRDGDQPKPSSKPATPLDQLLTSLSKASNFDVEDVQEQLIEQVQIGDRRELIQQKELLVKLIKHPNAEIRRTAAWALGRTNDLSLARHLVTALEDPEVDVNVEAHNALCWISRKPAGFDLQLDPFEALPLDAGPDLRDATLQGWRTAALKAWGEWYLKNRPYKERGDEFEAKLREKLALLK